MKALTLIHLTEEVQINCRLKLEVVQTGCSCFAFKIIDQAEPILVRSTSIAYFV